MKRNTIDGQSDPSFDLPLENELLILKLKAEFGAECSSGTSDIPPDVVNDFLRSVYEFEQKFREEHKVIRVFEKIGKPYFRRSADIPENQISIELRRVKQVLNRNQLELDVLGEYPDRLIYRFITEEFFYHEMDDLDLKGYIHHFCYEDFHPNYELEIRQRSVEFITQWFSRKLGDYSWQLSDVFIHPDGREFQKEDILKRVRYMFEAYTTFVNGSYVIEDIVFDWDEQTQTGRGFVKGCASYDAKTEEGELIGYEGKFEFYLSSTKGWWSIFYFIFPGFAW